MVTHLSCLWFKFECSNLMLFFESHVKDSLKKIIYYQIWLSVSVLRLLLTGWKKKWFLCAWNDKDIVTLCRKLWHSAAFVICLINQ